MKLTEDRKLNTSVLKVGTCGFPFSSSVGFIYLGCFCLGVSPCLGVSAYFFSMFIEMRSTNPS